MTKKRTAYVHQLEHDYQALRKSYDELENDMFGDAQDMTKAEQRRRKKIQAYDKIMSGYSALQFMQNVTWLTVNHRRVSGIYA